MDIRGHGDSSADWPQYHPTAVGHDIAAVIRQSEIWTDRPHDFRWP